MAGSPSFERELRPPNQQNPKSEGSKADGGNVLNCRVFTSTAFGVGLWNRPSGEMHE
jgi:hypothetical protein